MLNGTIVDLVQLLANDFAQQIIKYFDPSSASPAALAVLFAMYLCMCIRKIQFDQNANEILWN